MKQLLMIDDDEKLVSLVREYLAPHGFDVQAAHDGPAGLAALRSSEPALVILDLMLPGLDGLEVCRRIRQRGRLPVLMLTARGDEADRIVGLEMGADDYLPKPFSPRELLARIRAILRRAESEADTARLECVEAGNLVLDPGSRTATLAGVELDLTTGEFDLLYALASNAGRVLTRDQLMQRLHGVDSSAFDRSIDVQVSRIRQKIERDPRRPALLKTVRGVGYQFARAKEAS
jgi:DNA-binding response OmpR family regulator